MLHLLLKGKTVDVSFLQLSNQIQTNTTLTEYSHKFAYGQNWPKLFRTQVIAVFWVCGSAKILKRTFLALTFTPKKLKPCFYCIQFFCTVNVFQFSCEEIIDQMFSHSHECYKPLLFFNLSPGPK